MNQDIQPAKNKSRAWIYVLIGVFAFIVVTVIALTIIGAFSKQQKQIQYLNRHNQYNDRQQYYNTREQEEYQKEQEYLQEQQKKKQEELEKNYEELESRNEKLERCERYDLDCY